MQPVTIHHRQAAVQSGRCNCSVSTLRSPVSWYDRLVSVSSAGISGCDRMRGSCRQVLHVGRVAVVGRALPFKVDASCCDVTAQRFRGRKTPPRLSGVVWRPAFQSSLTQQFVQRRCQRLERFSRTGAKRVSHGNGTKRMICFDLSLML